MTAAERAQPAGDPAADEPAMDEPAVPRAVLPEPSAGVRGIADRCAPSAERRGDQMYGTAAPVRRWLLVERPGPWGRNALWQSKIDSEVVERLAARTATAGLRLLLIRRPGRTPAGGVRRWAHADSRPGQEGVWWGSYAADRNLLDLPLDGEPGGRASTDPVYLVCAHGSHDACCAIRGRKVAAALAEARPEQTWECSHIGGDRFAANVVVLPHGLYYGHVPPQAAVDLARTHESGRVVAALLRGRSSFAAPVQAAQNYARRELGDDRLDAYAPLGVRRLAGQRWKVTLAAADGPVAVTVEAGRMVTPVRLTCSAREPETVRVFRLVAIER